MKKIFLLTIFALAAFDVSFAQEITISRGSVDYTNGTVETWIDIAEYPGSSAYTFTGFTIKNTGTAAKTLKMKRIQENVLQGTSNYFCWTLCYGPSVNESPVGDDLVLQPNAVFNDMFLDYAPIGQLGVSTIRYVIQNTNDPNDTASIRVNFNATPTSINEISSVAKLNALFPNPANNNLTVNYVLNQGQASIEVKNMLGQVQSITPIVVGTKSTNLNVAELPTGIYFVSLKSNGNIIDTKRLVVN
jgi:hypothetical protein